MPTSIPDSPQSILDGVHDIIDDALKVKGIGKKPHYKHEESYQKLTDSPPRNFDAEGLLNAIYGKIESNRNANRVPSKENWRWKTNLEKPGQSSEVRLERRIVKVSDDMVNQVPMASGLVNESSDKRCAIDLVHKCEDGWYEFIELKVKSDTPLYAAMEIWSYGVLYIFSRKNRKTLGYKKEQNPLLWAAGIHLKVLAPNDYYERCKLDWLDMGINESLSKFLHKEKADYKMDFQFQAFPPDFRVDPCFPPDPVIAQALRDRSPVNFSS